MWEQVRKTQTWETGLSRNAAEVVQENLENLVMKLNDKQSTLSSRSIVEGGVHWPRLVKRQLPRPEELDASFETFNLNARLLNNVNYGDTHPTVRQARHEVSNALAKVTKKEWEKLEKTNSKWHRSLSCAAEITDIVLGILEESMNGLGAQKLARAKKQLVDILHYRLFKDLEEAKGKAFADRRPWLNKALDGYFLLLTEVFNVAYQGHEGLEVVKNIAALDLARVVFDFKQDSDCLYAVRIYFERKHILDSLVRIFRMPPFSVADKPSVQGNHGIHLTMSPLIASTREPSSFSISDPMKRIEDVYRAVQFKGSPEGLHKIITQLDGIEATLKENIQQNGGWDSFRTRCPPWSPCNSNISAAVLINQVLLKWYNLHGKLTSIGLEESEQAFVTIFKETGLEYKVPSPPYRSLR
ncbi:hypothetical protein JCM3765_004322 [Sporobolomyces pararoseus]